MNFFITTIMEFTCNNSSSTPSATLSTPLRYSRVLRFSVTMWRGSSHLIRAFSSLLFSLTRRFVSEIISLISLSSSCFQNSMSCNLSFSLCVEVDWDLEVTASASLIILIQNVRSIIKWNHFRVISDSFSLITLNGWMGVFLGMILFPFFGCKLLGPESNCPKAPFIKNILLILGRFQYSTFSHVLKITRTEKFKKVQNSCYKHVDQNKIQTKHFKVRFIYY